MSSMTTIGHASVGSGTRLEPTFSAPRSASFDRGRPEAGCTCITASKRCSSSSPARQPCVLRPGEEQLSPGDVVYFPEGPDGLHDFSNPTDEPVRLIAISSKRFPDIVAYPERGVAWVATRHPERPVPTGGDEGIIARFDLPTSP